MPKGGFMGRGQFKGAKTNERPMRPGKPDGTKGKRKASSDMAMLQERMPR